MSGSRERLRTTKEDLIKLIPSPKAAKAVSKVEQLRTA